jgi:hypothetical protein
VKTADTMQPLLLYTFGPIETGVIVITVVVIIYSVAKAIMRRIENKKDKEEHGGRF